MQSSLFSPLPKFAIKHPCLFFHDTLFKKFQGIIICVEELYNKNKFVTNIIAFPTGLFCCCSDFFFPYINSICIFVLNLKNKV